MPTTLATLKTRARRRCDQENSLFVSDAELTSNINASHGELYDLLLEAAPDRYVSAYLFTVASGGYSMTLPSDYFRTRRVEKLCGSRYRRLARYNMSEEDGGRGRYRVLGTSIFLQPEDNAAGSYRLWYVPVLTALVADTDAVDYPNGWEEFICIDAAIKCLVKEESSIEALMAAKTAIAERIVRMAGDRDLDEPERVADTSSRNRWDRGDY